MLHVAEYVAPVVGLEQDVEHCLFQATDRKVLDFSMKNTDFTPFKNEAI